MDKDFLILIWQNHLFEEGDLRFSTLTYYEVISSGLRVHGAAVDFTHARLRNRATGEVIAGSVKVDVKSSDWRSQGTINSTEMSGVMLHLVFERDTELFQYGFPILTCILTPSDTLIRYRERMAVGCEQYFAQLDTLKREAMIERLYADRLGRKSDEIISIAHSVSGDWEEVAYICLMRSMGFKLKKQTFEKLARSLPLSYLLRHRSRPILIEALLLGQAGYLEIEDVDDYTATLQREFHALKAENALLTPALDWRAAEMRSYSAPAISLARIAAIISADESLAERVLRCRTADDLFGVFDIRIHDYWRTHYEPSRSTEMRGLSELGAEKINLLIINFVVPFMAAYGAWFDMEHYTRCAIDLLEQTPAESNKYTRRWAAHGLTLRSAYVSQAIIELCTVYCEAAHCSRCPVGASQIVTAARP